MSYKLSDLAKDIQTEILKHNILFQKQGEPSLHVTVTALLKWCLVTKGFDIEFKSVDSGDIRCCITNIKNPNVFCKSTHKDWEVALFYACKKTKRMAL